MACYSIDTPSVALELTELEAEKVVLGRPRTGSTTVPAPEGLEVGIWEHTVGTSRDVEEEEIFVVISGRGTLEIEGGPTLELKPGSLVHLEAGCRTTWVVHESLRKVWISRT